MDLYISHTIFFLSWVPVIEYIESKYEEFLNAESRVMRRQIPDSRVHCCLYFVAPSGHGLKPLDVEFMQRLHDKVNIIPVIAKADTMTPDECSHFKKQVSYQNVSNFYSNTIQPVRAKEFYRSLPYAHERIFERPRKKNLQCLYCLFTFLSFHFVSRRY